MDRFQRAVYLHLLLYQLQYEYDRNKGSQKQSLEHVYQYFHQEFEDQQLFQPRHVRNWAISQIIKFQNIAFVSNNEYEDSILSPVLYIC